MSRDMSRLPLAVEVRVRSLAKPCKNCGDSVAMREVSLRAFRFSPASTVRRVIHT